MASMTVEKMISEIAGRVDDLRRAQEVHGDLLAIINSQCVLQAALLNGVMDILQEVLTRQGIGKDAAAKYCKEAFLKHFAAAQSHNVQALDSAGASRLHSDLAA
jgi:hypothetical protein